jgi:hypothetical protein
MMGKFEEYLEKQHHLPDIEIPDDEKIWMGISDKLGRTRRLKTGLFRAAAVILLLFSSGLVISYFVRERKTADQEYSLQNISKQLGEEESFFRLTVLQKMEEVKRTGTKGNEYYEMMEDLKQIDRQYDRYITDLQELGNQPKILKGIIRCYEMKIRVIEKTLNKIERTKNHENEKHIL